MRAFCSSMSPRSRQASTIRWSRLLPQRFADCFAISILPRMASGPMANAVRRPGARILEKEDR